MCKSLDCESTSRLRHRAYTLSLASASNLQLRQLGRAHARLSVSNTKVRINRDGNAAGGTRSNIDEPRKVSSRERANQSNWRPRQPSHESWLEFGSGLSLDSDGRTIWIVNAQRDGKRFMVQADEKLRAFLELESATRTLQRLPCTGHTDPAI